MIKEVVMKELGKQASPCGAFEVMHVWYGVMPDNRKWNACDFAERYRGIIEGYGPNKIPCKVESKDGEVYELAGNASRDIIEFYRQQSEVG